MYTRPTMSVVTNVPPFQQPKQVSFHSTFSRVVFVSSSVILVIVVYCCCCCCCCCFHSFIHTFMASLSDRREQLNRHFFKSILSQSSCIFFLLPPPRDLNVTSRLRTASTYPRLTTRTKRYTSFVQHGLLHY